MDTENEKTLFFIDDQAIIQSETEENQQANQFRQDLPQLENQEIPRQNFRAFLKTDSASYIATIILTFASVTAIFLFQNEDLLRNLSGLLLTLGLPGYALLKALFPPKTLRFERQGHLGWLLTGVLSVVLSMIVVALVGFTLDLTPIGITLTSLNLSLFSLTLFFSTIGLWRRYNAKTLAV